MKNPSLPHRLTRRTAVLAALSLPLAQAARAQDAALIDAAKKEGQLVWYTGIIINQLVRPLTQAFEQKYGIKVNFVSALEPEMFARLTNEARAGKPGADIFDTSGALMPPLIKAGLVERYAPASAAGYPSDMRSPEGYWTSLYSLYLTAGYNTDLIKENEVPRSFEDLLDPKWKGRMVWADIRTISGPAGFIANVLKVMGPDAGMVYLRKLAQQKIVGIPSNQRVVLDQVIAGQYAIGLMIYNHHTYISQERGAPVRRIKLEPFVGHLGVIAMTKGGPSPNAARLFLEYIFSLEGQQIVGDANYPASHPRARPKNPAIGPVTGDFKAMIITPEMTGAPLAGWLKIYDELFK